MDETIKMDAMPRSYYLNRGDILSERYKVIKRIGSGGFADVYIVNDLVQEKIFACKVFKRQIDEKTFEFIKREVDKGQTLNHQNLLKIYSLEKEKKRKFYFIIMEYIEGKNLQQILDENGPLSIEEFEKILEDVLKGLSYIHSLNLVHRDIKPSNILISKKGEIKLADFGLLKPIAGETITKDELFYATPEFSSPEFYDGERPTPQSDLYSLGITSYYLLTGNIPFKDEDPLKTLKKHKTEKFPQFPKDRKIPNKLKNFVFILTQKEPKKRPKNAEEAMKIFKKKKIRKPMNLKYHYFLTFLIFLFLFLFINFNSLKYIRINEEKDEIKILNNFKIPIIKRKFEGVISNALFYNKSLYLILNKDKIRKTMSEIYRYNKKNGWEKIHYEFPEYFKDKIKEFNCYFTNKGKNLFFTFLDHNSSASTLAYLYNDKITTLFSNKGHIDQNIEIYDITGDGIPDLIDTCYANSFGRAKAIFAIRGKRENNLNYFYFISNPEFFLTRSSGIIFYTLIEPRGWNTVNIGIEKNLILLKDIDNKVIERVDFCGNLSQSPFFDGEEKEKGNTLKFLFYNDYFNLKNKINQGLFEEGMELLKKMEYDYSEILKETPLNNVFLLEKFKVLKGLDFNVLKILEEEVKNNINEKFSLLGFEFAILDNDYIKADYFETRFYGAEYYILTKWELFYIKFLDKILKSEYEKAKEILEKLKIEEPDARYIANDLEGFIDFLKGDFKKARENWTSKRDHLKFINKWVLRMDYEEGKDVNKNEIQGDDFFLLAIKEEGSKNLKENFLKCLKISKISMEKKFELPFIGYDLSIALKREKRIKESKEILFKIKDLIPESYINNRIKLELKEVRKEPVNLKKKK